MACRRSDPSHPHERVRCSSDPSHPHERVPCIPTLPPPPSPPLRASFVCYNGFIAGIVNNDPEVTAAQPADRPPIVQRLMDRLSSRGYALGYLGGLLCLLVCVGIAVALSRNTVLAYRLCVCVSGIWWLVFSIPVWRHLRSRPGPPLPKGAHSLTYPFAALGETVASAPALWRTFSLVGTYFLYSVRERRGGGA
jgi:MFS transporter, UMF1 family